MLAGDWWRREPAERPSFERITARLCLQGSSNERRRSALSQLLSGCCQDCQAYLARYGRGVGPAVRNLVLQARGGVAVVYCGACAIAGKVVGPVGGAVRGGVMRASAAASRLGDTRIPLSAVALDVAFPRFHVVVHAFQCACELTQVYPIALACRYWWCVQLRRCLHEFSRRKAMSTTSMRASWCTWRCRWG